MGPISGREVAATEPFAAHDAGRGSGRRPRRRPRFRHRRDAGQSVSTWPPEVPLMEDDAGEEAHAAPTSEELATLPCIINWSNHISRSEEDHTVSAIKS
jgi:hypothetical protein